MGSKSSSSTTQETAQQGVEGVTTGTILQGENITITENFPDAVADAFSDLIGIVGSSLDVAKGSGEFAVNAVAERRFSEEQPALATTEKCIPVLLGIAALGAFVMVTRKGKIL